MLLGDQPALSRGRGFGSQRRLAFYRNLTRPGYGTDVVWLSLLSAIAASVVLFYGGMSPPELDWNLLGLGLFATAFGCSRITRTCSPDLPWQWALPLAGFPLLIALQLVPLPIGLVRVLSPARAELAASATPFLGSMDFLPISVEPGATFRRLILLLACLAVFLVIRELSHSLGTRRWLLALPLVAIALAEACLALTQWTAGGAQVQASGTYVNPNHFAGLLGLAAPLAVSLVSLAHPMSPHDKSSSWRDLGLTTALGVVALLVVGILVSVSRMGLIAALAGMSVTVAMLVLRGPRKSLRTRTVFASGVLTAVAMLSAFLYLSPDKLISRFGYLTSVTGIGAQSRLPLWRDTLHLIREYLLLGCGFGAFEAPFLKHKLADPMLIDRYAHNDYLQILAETGIAGFVLLLCALYAVFHSCWGRRVRTSIGLVLAAGAFGSITAISLHSLTDFNLFIPANAMVVSWIGGMAATIEDTSFGGTKSHATPATFQLPLYLPLRWACRR